MKRSCPIQLVAIFLFISLGAHAQQISGVVTSSEDGLPLIGVNVVVKGTAVGTITDLDGSYAFNIDNAGDTLVFSYTGFADYEVAVNGQPTINVIMESASELLAEVVVIGYGTMRKSDLTGSVYSVRGDDLVKNPDSNPLQALQGKVPGVQVSSVSGNPGENPVVRIRGVATLLGGAAPVFVVDGVILDDISFLNTKDIESIEVLKDASATAIYGTRGANGVIIITTKRGQEGKAVVSAGVTYSTQFVHQKIDLLDTRGFTAAVNELNPGTFNNVDILPNTDWQSEVITQGAPIQQYDLSVSGGSDRYTYYLGGGFYTQDGVVEKSDYERISLKLNNELKATSFLTIGTNLAFSKEDKRNAPSVIATAYRAWPTTEPLDDDGNFLEVFGSGNPIAALEYSNNFDDRSRGVGNLYTDINILQGLTFRTSYQLDWLLFENVSFSPVFHVSPTQTNEINDLTRKRNAERIWIWENTLRYNKEIGRHRFGVLAGYTSQETNKDKFEGTIENLLREERDFWYLNAGDATTLDSKNEAEIFSYISYLFRANYTLDNKYLFTATFRRDGSSKFGPNNRYGNFPSIALGWRLSEEGFIKELDLFSTLKLRGSWGVNGNDKIPYRSRFARVSTNDMEAVLGIAEELFPGASLTDAGNPNLQWENTESLDLGLEFGLMDGKLSGEIDYYRKKTNEVLVPLLIPAHFGNGPFNRVVFNAADVENKGFELFLTWKERSGEFNYSVSLLASKLKNEVLDIGAADEFISDGPLGNGQLVTRTETGRPIGAFFGYQVEGVFQTQDEITSANSLAGQRPGDLRFKDANNDGQINADDRTFIGSYIPDYLGGLNFTVGYKNVELSVDLQGQFGNEIYNGKRAVRPNLQNFEANIIDRWTGPNTSTTEPRLTAGGNNYLPSSYFIEDGSFVRLRSVSLTYKPGNVLLEKLRLQNASVFLRGTNVLTLTDFSGYSPEIASQNALSSGIDLGTYPVTAVYSLGLNLGF